MKTITSTPSIKAHWLSDIHLDQASDQQCNLLLEKITSTESDCLVVSGDISKATKLLDHLSLLAAACAPNKVFFVTGNHDYHGGNIRDVESHVNALCTAIDNLHHIDGSQIIPLSRHVCLIGHRGWPDARAGYGQHTVVDSPDRHVIEDFDGLTLSQSLEKMTMLGLESARVIRHILPLALTQYRHVVVLTHVPPFSEAAMYDNKPCGPTHSPHYVNQSFGMTINAIARAFPRRLITVLSGHTHHACMIHVRPNVIVRVGHARTGMQGHCEVLEL